MLDPLASRFARAVLLSGLMDAERLTACWNAIPPAKREEPEHIDRRLARQAVQSQALTLWQAQQLLAGRTNGFKVDRYVLLELIGQGGMGRVYLARDTRLNRKVALKILAPERISNPRAVARFQREARVGAQLQHENLVRVYDFGESNGRFFLVMEYIEGKTIGHLLSEQGPMPPATAVRLVRQVAQGLAHADRKGLIHRDVNPYNILVTHDGVAKLADLGLAIDLSEDDRVTREGATVGTFDYVAPEQARHSHAADIRSDIYSLGCTLYHMLTGHVPFPSPSLPEKLFAHQATEPTPLEREVPGLPAGLGDVVRTMMRKRPEERYATPSQVVQALEPYTDDVSAASRIEAPRLSSDSSPPPGPGGRGASAPASRDESGDHGTEADRRAMAEVSPRPKSPHPDRERVLAASSAMPAAAVASSRAAATRPGGATAVAGASSRSSSDLDDPAIPLLTPTDDVAENGVGLPIVVDLGPEPPLRPVPARPGAVAGGGLAAFFSRAVSPAPSAASRAAGATARTRLVSHWRALPPWGRATILAVAAAMILVALVGLAGLLSSLWPSVHTSSVPGGPRTQKPNADRSLASPHQPPEEPTFVVRSHGAEASEPPDTSAKTLLEAAKAAMGRRGKAGYVELRNRSPLRLTPNDLLDLETWGGTIDLRAAPGTQPVIDVKMDSGRPFLSTGLGVSLTLVGLTFQIHYAKTAEPRPPVIHALGRVHIERCAFEVVAPRPDACRAVVTEGGSLDVDQSWFLGFDETIRVKAYDETDTRIHQTMIVPEPGMAPAGGRPPELRGWAVGVELLPGKGAAAKRKLVLDHCTIEGAGLLEVRGDAGPSPPPVHVAHCAVRAEALLAWKPRKPGDGLSSDIQWKGDGNQFQIVGRPWVVSPAGTTTPAPTPEVTDLAGWTKFVAHEAAPIKIRILYQTEPSQRTDSPRPQDLAIESPEPVDDRAGADPALVGPWGR